MEKGREAGKKQGKQRRQRKQRGPDRSAKPVTLGDEEKRKNELAPMGAGAPCVCDGGGGFGYV